MADDTDTDRAFERENALKKLDHEHEEKIKRLENAWARRREATQFTKDYSLFTLRSLLLLNGGAILAMLAFIGNLYGRIERPSLRISDFTLPIILFAVGLIATIVAAIFGYFNFFISQRHYASVPITSEEPKSSPGMRKAMYVATAFGTISLCMFFIGVITVVRVLAR